MASTLIFGGPASSPHSQQIARLTLFHATMMRFVLLVRLVPCRSRVTATRHTYSTVGGLTSPGGGPNVPAGLIHQGPRSAALPVLPMSQPVAHSIDLSQTLKLNSKQNTNRHASKIPIVNLQSKTTSPKPSTKSVRIFVTMRKQCINSADQCHVRNQKLSHVAVNLAFPFI